MITTCLTRPAVRNAGLSGQRTGGLGSIGNSLIVWPRKNNLASFGNSGLASRIRRYFQFHVFFRGFFADRYVIGLFGKELCRHQSVESGGSPLSSGVNRIRFLKGDSMSEKVRRLSSVTGDFETGENRGQQPYEPPKLVSYTSEEILEQVGPAQACSPSPCGIF